MRERRGPAMCRCRKPRRRTRHVSRCDCRRRRSSSPAASARARVRSRGRCPGSRWTGRTAECPPRGSCARAPTACPRPSRPGTAAADRASARCGRPWRPSALETAPPAARAQHVESLRAGHLVDEMKSDEELGLPVRQPAYACARPRPSGAASRAFLLMLLRALALGGLARRSERQPPSFGDIGANCACGPQKPLQRRRVDRLLRWSHKPMQVDRARRLVVAIARRDGSTRSDHLLGSLGARKLPGF